MQPVIRILLQCIVAALVVACASERNYVSDGEMWWSDAFGSAAQDLSISNADRIWDDNTSFHETATAWSVTRAEHNVNAALEPTANAWSIGAAERSLAQNTSWQELVKRFSVSQTERDFVKDAKR